MVHFFGHWHHVVELPGLIIKKEEIAFRVPYPENKDKVSMNCRGFYRESHLCWPLDKDRERMSEWPIKVRSFVVDSLYVGHVLC